ncbi:MAG: DUF2341 domain-containing protein [Nanoarchaeota archaeon]|nr:DUF2341 domain-containing protein [Nanoarchaeota archaeon]
MEQKQKKRNLQTYAFQLFFVVFVISFVFFFSIAYAQNSEVISFSSDSVFVGEEINISLNIENLADTQLTIYHDVNAYRFFGTPELVTKFRPKETGEYRVELMDIDSQDVIDERNFLVLNIAEAQETPDIVLEPILFERNDYYRFTPVINLEKSIYNLNETVVLQFNNTLGNHSIIIVSKSEKYLFLDDGISELKFSPKSEGLFFIQLYDGDNILVESKEFYVGTDTILEEIHEDEENELDTLNEIESVKELLLNLSRSTGQQSLKKNIEVRNRVGTKINSQIKFRKGDIEFDQNEEIPYGEYDVDTVVFGKNIKRIRIKKLKYTGDYELKMDDLDIREINEKQVISGFAIDPSALDFEQADISIVASGTELWKCKNFEFDNQICFGEWVKVRDLVPGEVYSIKIDGTDPGFIETGVAIVNSLKPIYRNGEEAELYMVVLDKSGYLADADVFLRISAPDANNFDLSTQSGNIIRQRKGVYKAVFTHTYDAGFYSLEVRALGNKVDSNLTSSFLVQDFYEFEVSRESPLFIDPWQGPFQTSIRVVSYVDVETFNFNEKLPSDLILLEYGSGLPVTTIDGEILLTWYDLTNNSIVHYKAQAPLKTPDLLELGESYIEYEGGIFYEARPWYIAVDPAVVFKMETQLITDVGEDWMTANFHYNYIDPIVIATLEPSSSQNPDTSPISLRIRNVTSSTVEIRMMIIPHTSGTGLNYSDNKIYLLVTEAGYWSGISGMPTVEAGKHTTGTVGSKSAWSADVVSLDASWSGTAEYFHNPVTDNDPDWIESWTRGSATANPPTVSDFRLALNSMEVDPEDSHSSETIHYIVIGRASGTVSTDNGDVAWKAGRTADTIQQYNHNNLELHTFGQAPVWGVTDQLAMDGGDGGAANWEDSPFTATQIEPYIQEDRWTDTDITHSAEEVSYFIADALFRYDNNKPPNVTSLIIPADETSMGSVPVQFSFIVEDEEVSTLPNCSLYTNESGTFGPVATIYYVLNGTESNIYHDPGDGDILWNIYCYDNIGDNGFHFVNYSLTVSAAPVITVNSIEGDLTETYEFEDETPIVNATITRNTTCFISEFDETFSDMVDNGRINCGIYERNVSKICEYTNSLSAGQGTDYLYMSCNTTQGIENNNTNNKNMLINVLCDAHADCPTTQFCFDSTQSCEDDYIPGISCESVGIGAVPADEICQIGKFSTQPSAICINDSSYSYTGWYCTSDDDDCVYNYNEYDLNYSLCIGGTNDFRVCENENEWGSISYCSELNEGEDMLATASTHTNYNCSYYASPQTCLSGDLDLGVYGCQGNPTDCGDYIYVGGGSCGTLLADCDVGCGGECDQDNSTAPGIIGQDCLFDKTCNTFCNWDYDTEEAPEFCINDNNGGSCAYWDRKRPTFEETCYYTQTCVDIDGSGLSDSGTLRANYCDFCNATGNQNGDYAPAPNVSCSGNCPNTGTLYYDIGGTPTDRRDDCVNGTGTIYSDSLTIGDIWNGSSPGMCDNTECDLDCVTLFGQCLAGVCSCTDIDDPTIILISPADDYWDSDGTITYTYNASDYGSGIENCSLLVNGSVAATNFSVYEDEYNTFSDTNIDGFYDWQIECYDDSSEYNNNISEARIFGIDGGDPIVGNPWTNGTTYKVSDLICLNATASDALSGIYRVYASILLPTGSAEQVDMYDDQVTACDDVIGDGVYSVEYEIKYSGDFNWSDLYAIDRAGNSVSAFYGYFWNVTEGGILNANMSVPIADLEINESEGNFQYVQTCNATCDWGFVDCDGVELYVEYFKDDTWGQASTLTTEISTEIDSYDCGDLKAVQAPWWNESYLNRQQMRVKAQSAVAANHVIRVDFDTSGDSFQDNANDLRIVYWNGSNNIEVDRQVFQPNTSQSAIWFVIGESLSANSSNYNYYLYYGNENATDPKNNQSKIWLFYDDFSDGTYTDKWGYTAAAGGIAVASATNPWSGVSYVMDVGTACQTTYTKILTSELSPIRDMASRMLWMDNPGSTCGGDSPDADGVVGLQGSATTAYDGILVERDTDTGFHFDRGATGPTYDDPGDYSPFNVWQWSETRTYGTEASGVQAKYWAYTDIEPSVYKLTATDWANGHTATAGQPFARVASGRAHIAVVMVRPTVEFEPITQMKGEDDVGSTGNTTCQHSFTVTSGEESGNNTFGIRCRATSTNSEYAYSDNVTLTINDHPYADFFYPTNGTWLVGVEAFNASSSYDFDGTINNYLFEFDDNSGFTSPQTLCSTSDENCTFNTIQQTECLNNSLACYLRITVTDNDGLDWNNTIIVGFDTAGPVVTLGNPVNFTNVSSDYVVDATATDYENDVDVVTFEYRENATATWVLINTDDRSPYQRTWNISPLSDGNEYEVRAYANDTSGNIGNYDVHYNMTIDRTGPAVSLGNPPDDYRTNDIDMSFFYEMNDYLSEGGDCIFYLDDVLTSSTLDIIESSEYNFTEYSFDEDTFYWYINCTDSLGNENMSAVRNVSFDRTGPVTTIDELGSYDEAQGGSVILNASIIDAGVGDIGFTIFEYRNDEFSSWQQACNDTGIDFGIAACTWDISTFIDRNSYQIRAYSNDTVDNMGGYDTHTNITIDNNGPGITLLSPTYASVDGDGNVYFQYSVVDNSSQIQNCSLYIDNVLNETIFSPMLQSETLQYNITNMSDGDYYLNISCWDDFGIENHQAWSETRLITIEIRYEMDIDVSTEKFAYEKGNQENDIVDIITNVTDYFNNPLESSIVLDIIRSNNPYIWWNDSWDYRKLVTIEAPSNNKTNIKLEFTVDTEQLINENKMRSDCADARFADLDGEAFIYTYVSGCDTASTVFYVSLNLTKDQETDFFVYYGNLAATSESQNFASTTILGETGTYNTSNFQNVSLVFDNYYSSTPYIFLTPVSQNEDASQDDNAPIPVVHQISGTGAIVTTCIDENNAPTCPTAGYVDEEVHYFVINSELCDDFDWMDCGIQYNEHTHAPDTIISYDKTFSNVPYVFGSVQSYHQLSDEIGAMVWFDTSTTSQVEMKGCTHIDAIAPNDEDACDADKPHEDMAWIAIDPVLHEIQTIQMGFTNIDASQWDAITWTANYTNPRIMVTQNDDDGGQDTQYVRARDIYTATPDIRYCEVDDTYDYCDSHNDEIVRWFTVEDGDIIIYNGNSSFSAEYSIGGEEEHILRIEDATDITGIFEYGWNFAGQKISNYTAISYATKPKYYDAWNHSFFEVKLDSTGPNVSLTLPLNGSSSNSTVTFRYLVNDTLSTIANCSLFIDDEKYTYDDTIIEDEIQFFYPFIPGGGWHKWSVSCTDYYGNSNLSQPRWIFIKPPDLYILSEYIMINSSDYAEGQNITINATLLI